MCGEIRKFSYLCVGDMAASMCHQGFLEIIEARYALFKHCILIVSMKKTSLFFLLLGAIVVSVVSLIKGSNNFSMVDTIKNILKFETMQKEYRYRRKKLKIM